MKVIPVIAGIIIIVGGILAGVGAVRFQTSKQAEAMEAFEPKLLKISNISDTGFTVSWITTQATTGYAVYGESEDLLQMKTVDDRDRDQNTQQAYFVHFVTIMGLKPETVYYLKPGSGDRLFDLSGQAYKIVTGPAISDQSPADAAYGQVVTENNEPAEGAIVYLQIPGASLLSALTKSSGSWAIPLATARSEDLKTLVKVDKQNTVVSIWVESASMGNSSASLPATIASPVPTMTLGKIYDFTSNLKANKSVESKFETENTIIPVNISLLSPIENESLATNQPVIIGKAPPGTKISIEVNSEAVIKSEVTADSMGNFSFQVPQNLPEGEHTITISAMVNGVLRTIKKSFVVSAQTSSSPFYTATPSATLKPSSAPTKTPTATVTPKPTLIALAPTATVVPTSTVKPTPLPTLLPSISPTVTKVPTNTPRPTLTPSPTIVPKPTVTPEIPKSGSTGMTLIVSVLGASLMLAGYTLGNDKKRNTSRI